MSRLCGYGLDYYLRWVSGYFKGKWLGEVGDDNVWSGDSFSTVRNAAYGSLEEAAEGRIDCFTGEEL